MSAALIALSLVLASGAADDLTQVQLGDISLAVPGSWKRTTEDSSTRFSAPTNEAYFLVDTGKVSTKGMKPEVCRKKILAQMPPVSKWKLLDVGGKPAASAEDSDEAKDGVAIQTYTFVGCDGVTTWSLVFHFDGRRKEHFAPLAQKVAHSLTYGSK